MSSKACTCGTPRWSAFLPLRGATPGRSPPSLDPRMGRRITQSIRIRPLDRHAAPCQSPAGIQYARVPRGKGRHHSRGLGSIVRPYVRETSSRYQAPPPHHTKPRVSNTSHKAKAPTRSHRHPIHRILHSRSPTTRSPHRRPNPLPSKFSPSPSPFPTPPFRPFFPTTVSYRPTRLRGPQAPPPLPLPPATTSGSVSSTASVHAHSRLPRISKITAHQHEFSITQRPVSFHVRVTFLLSTHASPLPSSPPSSHVA